ncbi:MAG: hypothetical protein R3324_07940, partial [Halobacteriales archaeon]|nr:hypothetical protein [Halobacteriales archaeon]
MSRRRRSHGGARPGGYTPTSFPPVFCLTLRSTPDRAAEAKGYLERAGVPFEFFYGFDAHHPEGGVPSWLADRGG